MGSESSPLVSVVVTTKNEERNIETCLLGISEQTYSPIEIIVVDNGSTDGTKEAARKFTEKVFDCGPERSAQRNYGMLVEARGRYVMYLDADMIPSPDLVEACVERISLGDCVALHIPEVVLGTSYFSRVRRFERTFYDGTLIDAARFFCSDMLRRVGGFDENMTGVEDWDLDKKIKQVGRIALLGSDSGATLSLDGWPLAAFIRSRGVRPEACRASVFHDESDFGFRRYLHKKKYYAQWFDIYAEKWGCNDRDVRKQLGFPYRYFVVFLENGRWKRLLGHPILTGGMYCLRALVGAAYLTRLSSSQLSLRPPLGYLGLPLMRNGQRKTGNRTAIDQYAEAHPQFGGSEEITPLLDRALGESTVQAPVLDIGCGEGGTLPALRDAGRRHIIGCELSGRRAAVARRRGFMIVLADALQLPIADDSVGLSVVRHVIEHVEDDFELLKEVRRVLAPGAWVYLETPIRLRGAWYPYKNPSGEWMLDPTHLREYRTVQELLDLFVRADLHVESSALRRIRFPLVHGFYRLFPRMTRTRREPTGVTVAVPRYREVQVLGRKL